MGIYPNIHTSGGVKLSLVRKADMDEHNAIDPWKQQNAPVRQSSDNNQGNDGGQRPPQNNYENRSPQNNNGNSGGGWKAPNPNNSGGYQNRSGGGGGYGGGNSNGGYRNNGGGGGFKGGFQRKELTPEELVRARPYQTCVISGNDNPPEFVINIIGRLIPIVESLGYIVRSGGMKGIDNFVETFTRKVELHLPWKGFDNKDSKSTFNSEEAKEYAKRCHPTWDGIKPAAQAFFAKNVRMVYGKELKSPTQFVVIWSEDGAEQTIDRTARTGMAGHILALARQLRIPVFNLQNQDAEQRILRYLEIEQKMEAPVQPPVQPPVVQAEQPYQPQNAQYLPTVHQPPNQPPQQGQQYHGQQTAPVPTQTGYQPNHERQNDFNF